MKYIILTKRGLTAITAVTLSALLIVFGICGRKSALSSAAAEEGQNGFCPSTALRRTKKKVAVTFDAAWGADDTEKAHRILKKSQCQGYVFRRRGMGGKISRQRKGVLCLRTRDRKSLCIAQYVFESYKERNHKRHNTL